MEGEYETAPKLSNGAILNELEWPLTQISRLRQSYNYNGGPIESRMWSIKRRHFQWLSHLKMVLRNYQQYVYQKSTLNVDFWLSYTGVK